ncbi:MAG: hypothetical protein M0042_11410 [Nitrospiraceae bacterium]|nr:hypothetical protein [Nitrospiraceae bacterium]
MRTRYAVSVAFVGMFLVTLSPAFAGEHKPCADKDALCKEFARLAEAEQYDKIVEKVDAKTSYSDASREYIGQAYLMVAGKDTNTPEQEEQLCLKALEYGATSAYMGLYFLSADKSPEKALNYLRQYVSTKPQDAVPYVILGEAEFDKSNYLAAHTFLMEAKRVGRGKSANLDWMLFQTGYLTGDYAAAASMLESAFAQGKTMNDLQTLLKKDARFSELEKRAEFRKFFPPAPKS